MIDHGIKKNQSLRFESNYLLLYLLCAFLLFTAVNLFGEVFIEGRGAYFCPTESKFEKTGGGLFSGEATCPIYDNWQGWISAGYFSADVDSNDAYLIPIGAGIKYGWCHNQYLLYLGAGLTVSYLHMIEWDFPYGENKISKWGAGAILKSGVIFPISDRFIFDIFADYSFVKISGVDAGGVSVGLGIGMALWQPVCQDEDK